MTEPREQDGQSIDFLYDFIYLDHDRVKTWVSQVFPDGLQVNLRSSSTTQNKTGKSAEVSLPTLAKGELKSSETVEGVHEKTFDTSFAAPIELINKLDELGYIHFGLSSAALGSLVLVYGAPNVIDFSTASALWDAVFPIARKKLQDEAASRTEREKIIGGLKMAGDFIKVVPSTPQLYIETDDGDIAWSPLKRENITVTIDALTLTHGSSIPGVWHVLGVLDAFPDNNEVRELPFISNENLGIINAILQMTTVIRDSAGRSRIAYAVNPIAIFRAIRPADRAP